MANFAETYGPIALVTGASSGIGAAFAEQLAMRGLNLVIVARREDRLRDLQAKLGETYGVTVTPLCADLAKPDAAAHIVAATHGIDIGLVVSNAGFSLKGDHAKNDPSELTDMLMVNCQAPIQLAHGFIPRLRSSGRGGIILVSSIEALIGCPYSSAYSASKALVKTFGEGLWAELQPDGIDVLTLCPGATESEAAARAGMDPSKIEHMMKAEEVAALTLDNLKNGPTFISSEHYAKRFEGLLALPRRDALTMMAANLRQALG